MQVTKLTFRDPQQGKHEPPDQNAEDAAHNGKCGEWERQNADRGRAAALCADAHGAADGRVREQGRHRDEQVVRRDHRQAGASTARAGHWRMDSASVTMLASRMLPSTSPAPGTATAVGAGVEGGGADVIASDQSQNSDAEDGEDGRYEHEV
ncbi:hypothetical protein DL770_006017 [Monosporascus sp. CRB-9-2]|nr:hypothetical protein DL770_006017 [Monosporascus sp. CRB-9-2]